MKLDSTTMPDLDDLDASLMLNDATVDFINLAARIKAAPEPAELLMTPREVSVYTGLTVGQLAQMRFTGNGAPFLKPSTRTVLYRKGDVDDWLAQTKRTSTAREDY